MKDKLFLNDWVKVAVVIFPIVSFLSCAKDVASDEGNGEEALKGVFASVEEMEVVGETRSTLTYDATQGMLFAWDSGEETKDHLTVFPDNNSTSMCDYVISNPIRPHYAEFTATGFSLSDNCKYYAIGKSEKTAGGDTKIYSKSEIIFDYAGQVQSSNDNTAHLGKYDYLASAAVSEGTDNAHFSFKHLGSTLRIRLYMSSSASSDAKADFKATTFKSLEMYDSGNSFAGTKRTFSFTCDKHVDANGMPRGDWYKYDAKGDPFTPTDDNKQRFSVKLGESGFTPNANGELIVFMQVPPTDLTGSTIGFILKGEKSGQPKTYYFSLSGRPIEMGKAYKWGLVGSESTDFTVTLKVNHLWQHGNTLDNTSAGAKTRATGDPGYDDIHADPTHLYYFFCVDGKVIAKGTNHDVGGPLTDGEWSENKETHICTYNKPLHLTVNKNAISDISTARLYVVAGNRDLTTSTAPNMSYSSIIIDADESENAVKALTYNIISGDQTTTQAFMRDLYSTPWESDATFVGALTDPMQDVVLYHTAAKVDLQWNSSTTLPVTGESAYVKVNNVNASGLSVFKPITNTYSESGTYNVQSPIEDDRWINGRQVFYLPQFANNTCQYKVTIGNKTQETVNFSPVPVSVGFTSWLRWLKKY